MILKVQQLMKVFVQGDTSIYAVNNANMVLEEGQFAVITGKSGSGKSTFLNLCAGMSRPTAGKIYFCEKNVSEMNYEELSVYHRESTGMIFQGFDLLSILTVRENILLPVVLAKRAPNEKYFEKLVQFLGIEDRLDHFPSELSGGQAQRTAIARALMNHPKILFADEPTGNLDATTSQDIVELLLQVNQSGVAVMLVTHDLSIRERILKEAANGISYVMEDGVLRKV